MCFERERERDRQTDRQTDREKEREKFGIMSLTNIYLKIINSINVILVINFEFRKPVLLILKFLDYIKEIDIKSPPN